MNGRSAFFFKIGDFVIYERTDSNGAMFVGTQIFSKSLARHNYMNGRNI